MSETRQQRDERRYSYECNVIRENGAQFATFSYPSDAKKVCGILNRAASDEAAGMVTAPKADIMRVIHEIEEAQEHRNVVANRLRAMLAACEKEQ